MKKTERGKQTTRHAELIKIGKDSFIMDTPGFTSLEIFCKDKKDLPSFYHEFDEYKDSCRFSDCMHISEPGCEVKKACDDGKIPGLRYDNYVSIYRELSGLREVYKKG